MWISHRRQTPTCVLAVTHAEGRWQDQSFVIASHRRQTFLPFIAGQGGVWEAVNGVDRSVRSNRNLPRLPILDSRRSDGRTVGLRSHDGSSYLFYDVTASGRRVS